MKSIKKIDIDLLKTMPLPETLQGTIGINAASK